MGKVKPTRDMQLGRHARKAVQAIRDRGHTVRTEEDDKGQVCLIGAVRKVAAPMGSLASARLVHEFNMRFGEWMNDRYPASPEAEKVRSEFATVNFRIPATIWNDRVLLHGDEACAWLDKFADDVDPQRP